MTTTTYKVNADRMETLVEDMSKIAKRAGKLGVPTPAWSLSDLKIEYGADSHKIPVGYYELTLTCDPIKLAGWTFLATLDHASEVGVILRTVPGVELPHEYHDAKPICTHCGYTRVRKETFVLHHDDGRYAQVGRQCAHDFFGVDPTKFAKQSEFALTFHARLSHEHGNYSDGTWRFIDTEAYLSAVATQIRIDGFVSRKKARDSYVSATADLAYKVMNPPVEWTNATREQYAVTAADRVTAHNALDWARAQRNDQTELNDYMHNVTVVASMPAIESKHLGVAASIIPAYARAMEDVAHANRKSEYQGVVGQRADFGPLTIINAKPYAGKFGPSVIVEFRDDLGNVFKSFMGTKAFGSRTHGDAVSITGTVAAHAEYKGSKETTLSRVVFNVTKARVEEVVVPDECPL